MLKFEDTNVTFEEAQEIIKESPELQEIFASSQSNDFIPVLLDADKYNLNNLTIDQINGIGLAEDEYVLDIILKNSMNLVNNSLIHIEPSLAKHNSEKFFIVDTEGFSIGYGNGQLSIDFDIEPNFDNFEFVIDEFNSL